MEKSMDWIGKQLDKVVDPDKMIDRLSYIAFLVIKTLQPFLIALHFGLVLFVSRLTLIKLVDYTSPMPVFYQFVHFFFGLFVMGSIFFNYTMCVIAGPGFVPQDFLGDRMSRFCKQCNRKKPPLAHHCNICQTCVLRMDHHCPWTGACIGFKNHKFFTVWLFYLSLGCYYATYILWENDLFSCANPHGDVECRVDVIFAEILAVSIGLATSLFLLIQIYLCFYGLTSSDLFSSKKREENVYDLGAGENFKVFFGSSFWSFVWLLPSVTLPPGDGLSFKKKTLRV